MGISVQNTPLHNNLNFSNCQQTVKNSRERLLKTYQDASSNNISTFIKKIIQHHFHQTVLLNKFYFFLFVILSVTVIIKRSYSKVSLPIKPPDLSFIENKLILFDDQFRNTVLAIDNLKSQFEQLAAEESYFLKQHHLDEAINTIENKITSIHEKLLSEYNEFTSDVRSLLQKLDAKIETIEKRNRQLLSEYEIKLQFFMKNLEKLLQNDLDMAPNLILHGLQDKLDWAQLSLGAWISKPHTSLGKGQSSWSLMLYLLPRVFPSFQHRLPPKSKPAEIVLASNLLPGNCYALTSVKGNITIGLPTLVDVNEVQIDHPPKDMVPSGDTAIQKFRVYVDDCTKLPCRTLLELSSPPNHFVGEFEFNYSRNLSHQSFELSKTFKTRRLRFEILSNHGADYTCVYKLRVYGTKAD